MLVVIFVVSFAIGFVIGIALMNRLIGWWKARREKYPNGNWDSYIP